MKRTILTICLLTAIYFTAAGQDDSNALEQQVVTIYTEFTPVLKDAERIRFLPVITDTVTVSPEFHYRIRPSMFPTSFEPTRLNVATLKDEPLRPLDIGMLKIGFGNYTTPFVEAHINNRRNPKFSVGAYIKHHSSFGKIKNAADQKVYTGFMNNVVDLYGKRVLKNAVVYGNLNFDHDLINFYGYNPHVFDSLPLPTGTNISGLLPRDKKDMENQNYMRLKTIVGFRNNNVANNRFDVAQELFYQYFFTPQNNNQNRFMLDGDIAKVINKHRFGLTNHIEFTMNKMDTAKDNCMILGLHPYYQYASERWQIRAGVNTVTEFLFTADSIKPHFYPNVAVQYNISNTLIPYFSAKGFLQHNNYEHITHVNPFVSTSCDFGSTEYEQVYNLGLKGNIGRKVSFDVKADYSKIDNMLFFYNRSDSLLDLANKFYTEYANVERVTVYAEVDLHKIGNFSANLSGHYYIYTYIKSMEKPWHCPTVDVTLSTEYRINRRLNVGVNVDFVGPRWAKTYAFGAAGYNDYSTTKLKAIVDVSLYGEYKIASNFHAFLNLNNILALKNRCQWNNYMLQRFNMLAGIKYLF